MRSVIYFDRLLSFLFRLCCVESESVCLSLSDECIWFWWSLSLSDDVTEGSPEAFRPTVLFSVRLVCWVTGKRNNELVWRPADGANVYGYRYKIPEFWSSSEFQW